MVNGILKSYHLTEEEINLFKKKFEKNLSIQDIIAYYQEGDKDNYKTDLINTVYPLTTSTYEIINYNPFEIYSGTTHISANSVIPTNITVKNTGYNCLLKK